MDNEIEMCHTLCFSLGKRHKLIKRLLTEVRHTLSYYYYECLVPTAVSVPGQVEDGHQLASQHLSVLEALGVEDDLGDELVVRPAHGHGPEQLLQVVWQLLSAAVAFPCWVQGDEHPRVRVQLHLDEEGRGGNISSISYGTVSVYRQTEWGVADLLPQQVTRALVVFERVLNGLDLHGHGRQHCLF